MRVRKTDPFRGKTSLHADSQSLFLLISVRNNTCAWLSLFSLSLFLFFQSLPDVQLLENNIHYIRFVCHAFPRLILVSCFCRFNLQFEEWRGLAESEEASASTHLEWRIALLLVGATITNRTTGGHLRVKICQKNPPFARSGKCQNRKMSETENVRNWGCQNRIMSETESVRTGKCQKLKMVENWKCQKLNWTKNLNTSKFKRNFIT